MRQLANIKSFIIAGLVLIAVFTGSLLSVKSGVVFAAEGDQPALCYSPVFAGAAPGPCGDQHAIPYSTGDAKPNHCYTLSTSGTQPTYNNVPCSDDPFAGKSAASCKDGTIQVGSGQPEELCGGVHGGVIDTPITPNKFCGGGDQSVEFNIDIGCKGQGNPILDILFAAIKFLSYLVGLVLVGSMIVTGIQYSASRGNPDATAKMILRILHIAGAILLYVFAFAILNYVVPGALLK